MTRRKAELNSTTYQIPHCMHGPVIAAVSKVEVVGKQDEYIDVYIRALYAFMVPMLIGERKLKKKSNGDAAVRYWITLIARKM